MTPAILERPTLPHFKVRTPESMRLTRVRAALMKASRDFFEQEGYLEVVTPTITGATGACESVSTVFPVEYFGHSAFLIQTSQLHLEAFVFGTPKVYSINRSYRAEAKIDDRRLCEFSLIEFEAVDMSLEELLDTEERYIRHVLSAVEEMIVPAHRHYLDQPFKRMTYTEAIDVLQKEGFDVEWGMDLGAIHEKKLTELYGITFVTHYPEPVKFFNMTLNREDRRVVDCVDLLLPVAGESIGGSTREHDYELLKGRLESSEMLRQLINKGGKRSDFDWYLELFKDVELKRAGAGIGFERLVQFVTGNASIKECVEFVRDAATIIP